ncbi:MULTISPECIES: acyltransferase [unclassified Leifsonia]|uniref:acyltransferase family protein n=1 Tax=unclassified Leifsonia TaxID=2663824 RepID=UPI000A1977AC|nr:MULTISPECIES: acyltransferase [unclassified Leifsonia]QIZ97878.1 acyltransferase [Leifsonia sp. PS1209]
MTSAPGEGAPEAAHGAAPAATGHRYRSLDGLRGVAALSVVLYHALLVVPAVSVLYIEKSDATPLTPEWWLFRTPLRLVMPGHEAVLIFFVLSGFVLTLPLLTHRQSPRRILAYYGRRILRLYVPVWGAVAFALLLAVAVPRDPSVGSSWLATHLPPTFSAVWHDLVLVLGTSNLDSPLWSLTWEVWFSLLLPVMFVLLKVARVHDWWLGGIALLIALSAVSRFPAVLDALPLSWLTGGMLQYLPVFGIGMIVASRRETITRLATRIRSWWPVIAGALLLMISPSLVPTGAVYTPVSAALAAVSLIGVAGVVFIALEAPARRVLETRPVQWAGTRSFSVYLIHEPILVAAALVTRADAWLPWLFVALALLPVILLAAEGFYRVVERPSMLLSQRVGRAILAWPAARRRVQSTLDKPIRDVSA